MKLKALTTCAGRFTFFAGDEIDVSEDDAIELIDGGAALPIITEPVVVAQVTAEPIAKSKKSSAKD